MQLNNLPKTTTKSKKRVGRGYGSGKGGHTVGRGQKGQKSRNKVGLLFEGTKRRKSLMGRLPMMRGKGKLKSFSKKPAIVNVKFLNLLDNGATVDIKSLVKAGIIDQKSAKERGVKILGDGELTKKLTVKLPVSKGAKEKIEKAGGKVTLLRHPERSVSKAEGSRAHARKRVAKVAKVGKVVRRKRPSDKPKKDTVKKPKPKSSKKPANTKTSRSTMKQ